jgi:hypothetical protein
VFYIYALEIVLGKQVMKQANRCLILPILLVVINFLSIYSFAKSSEVPVSIDKESYYTKISPSPVPLGQTGVLTVSVLNTNETDIQCVLKVYGESIKITPTTEQNITAYGTYGAYPKEKRTSYVFYIETNSTGTFPIKIELWFEGRQVDFYLIDVHVKLIYTPTSYEIRLAAIYFFTIFVIIAAYLRVHYKDNLENFASSLFIVGIFFSMLIFMFFGFTEGELFHGFSFILSPSIGKIEAILAVTFIFCFVTLISLKDKPNLGLKLANALMLLISLPIVMDWLLVSTIPSDTLGSGIFWQLVEIIIVAVINAVLNAGDIVKYIKSKMKQT